MAEKILDHREPLLPLDSVQNSMMHGLGELAEYFGFNRTLGQIYGVLLLHEKPLCLEEIAEQVDKSKSSISQHTRTMEHLRVIRRVYRVDSDLENKRKYYEAETNLEIAARDLAQRKLNELERLHRIIGASLTQLKTARDTDKLPENEMDILIERVGLLYSFLTIITGFITSITEASPENDASRIDTRQSPGG